MVLYYGRRSLRQAVAGLVENRSPGARRATTAPPQQARPAGAGRLHVRTIGGRIFKGALTSLQHTTDNENPHYGLRTTQKVFNSEL